MMEYASLFIDAMREEVGHEEANHNEDLRAPYRRVYYRAPDGEKGRVPVVAETEVEALKTFHELLGEAVEHPDDYEVTEVWPSDEQVEALSEEQELAYSHLHRTADRRDMEKIETALDEVEV